MPTYTAPNATPEYQSVAYPLDSQDLVIKRGDGTTAGGGTATTLGTYFAESINITRPGNLIDRKGKYGQMKGEPTVVRNPSTLTCKVQIDATTTNTVRQGDYFEAIIDVDAATVSTTAVRFIVQNCVQARDGGTPHTFDLTAYEDQVNSPKYTV